MSLPTSVEPVNATLSTSRMRGERRARVSPKPVTMLTTPGGKPASSISSPRRSAESGVCSAGFSTTVLPQASAGPSFHAAISSGKFHGMIWPTTPTGSRSVYACNCGVGHVRDVGLDRLPLIFVAQPA